ncbi:MULTISPECIES: hypothetical protein [Pseudomonas]|uniref:Uncharacterized protein n=1 Tax=Pseudomonas lutea TaxID=243924 RepID=A0A9X8MH20_9PSED|nr:MULTISPECIES: hypothetical protein [Pseudomonas]SER36061.1 hypothetical protein SAMN05216409_11836 [Pseudomonas lutea]
MSIRTGIIKYNLSERGRFARGIERNLNTRVAARIINSPSVQERVKLGDMVGYFGHWPRVQFGLNPAEGGVVKGQAVSIEPALRLVSIKAEDNGDVEYEIEFFDNTSGKIAARMWRNKVGGFSSAIQLSPNDPAIAVDFFGFDYVIEPNYSNNRGYALDAAGQPIFDAVAEQRQLLEECNKLFESEQGRAEKLQAMYDSAMQTISKLADENEYLIDRLAKTGKPKAALDSVMDVTPIKVHKHCALDSADSFLTAPLAEYEPEPVVKEPEPPKTPTQRRTLHKYGIS